MIKINLIILFIIILGYTLLVNYKPIIPKQIWTFWDNEKFPSTVLKCINSWKVYNPDYKITILSKQSIKNYLPEIDILKLKYSNTPQRISDFIRINIIKKYGGFWLDATILLTGSLDYFRDIQQKNNYEFVGYYIDAFTTNSNYPVIENWFFGAIPDSEFIRIWCHIFLSINNHNTISSFVEKIKKNVDTQNICNIEYLTMHIAAQYALQKYMSHKDIENNLFLLKAEDGPLKYLAQNNWDSHKAIKALCTDINLKTPVIKFRGGERELIENNEEYKCVFN